MAQVTIEVARKVVPKKTWERFIGNAIDKKLFGPKGLFPMEEDVVAYDLSDENSTKAPHHGGVKHLVFKDPLPQTLVDVFNIPKTHGYMDKEFVVYGTERLTYGQAFERANALGFMLVNEFGVKRGDRVAIAMRNRPEFMLAVIAATSVGAIAVPLNSLGTGSELAWVLDNSETKVLLCDNQRFELMQKVLATKEAGDDDKEEEEEEGKEEGSSGSPEELVLNHLETVILCQDVQFQKEAKAIENLECGSKQVVTFQSVMDNALGQAMPPFPCKSKDEPAIILYTSGTTGRPKGVVLSHRSISHALLAGLSAKAQSKAFEAFTGGPPLPKGKTAKKKKGEPKRVIPALPGPQPVTLLAVPLFHVTGLNVVFLASMLFGAKIVIMYKWDTLNALQIIQDEKVKFFTGVPTMILQMLQHPRFNEFDTSSLTDLGGGGAASPPSIVKDVKKKMKKASPGQGYGLTETNAISVVTSARGYAAKPNSCGTPVPGVIVEIWDEAKDKPLPIESSGRIMIKGPTVMKEYWKNPEATAKAISKDGFFDTGDIGKLDKDGFLFILDRVKDLVIRGGENISTAEVEAAVYEHPAVGEAAVFSVPHPTLGEEVGLAVYPKVGHKGTEITLETLAPHCANLAAFKRPTHLFVYDQELPRGATGKILKRQIKEECKTRKGQHISSTDAAKHTSLQKGGEPQKEMPKRGILKVVLCQK